jgi:hypothetical protein
MTDESLEAKDARVSSIALMVEDPGALNFLEPLIDVLIKEGWQLQLFAAGIGSTHLIRKGYEVKNPPSCQESATNILRAYNCRAVIVGTSEDPHTAAFTLIDAARNEGITTIGVVDTAVNAEFRFRGTSNNPLLHAPIWLLVPDSSTCQAFEQLGFPKSHISVVGNPARDKAKSHASIYRKQKIAERSGTTKEDYTIVFVSELSNGLSPNQYNRTSEYTLGGRGTSTARTAIIAEELLDAKKAICEVYKIHARLILRLHPKQNEADLGSLCAEFDEVSSGGDPIPVLAEADLVVGMSSTLLLQAFDMGINCISVLPRAKERLWLPEVASGIIPSAIDRDNLRTMITRLLLAEQPIRKGGEETQCSMNAIDRMYSFISRQV